MDKTPVLYVFVNTNLMSMNPGKAQAHSGHASNAFMHKQYIEYIHRNENPWMAVREWMGETNQGFGTQINLKASWSEVYDLKERLKEASYLNALWDMVVDPTYPYLVDSEILNLIDPKHHSMPPVYLGDGRYACCRSEETAFYVFGYKEDLYDFVGQFPLHP